MSTVRSKLDRVAASLLPPPPLLLLLLLLLMLQGAPTRSTAANHGSASRRTKGQGELQALGTTTASASEEETLSHSEGKQGGPDPRPHATGHRKDSSNSRELDDFRIEDSEMLFDEPPVLTNLVPDEWVQRCSNLDASSFAHGAACGSPLAEPCFERGQCETGDGGATLPKIYVYDQTCSLADSRKMPIIDHSTDDNKHQDSHWREAAWKAGVLAETYDEACLFIHVNTHNHKEPCATRAPRWNGGVNHIMMEFTPWWIEGTRRSSISNTYAMDWAFDSLSCYYRSGFDLSLPLVPGKLFPEYQLTPPTARQYFMTFKGTLYLRKFGIEERSVVSRLHNPSNGIVSVIRCSTMHGDELLPENKNYCDRSRRRFDTYDYKKLMNTTFALVPSGRSPGTFRLGEVMSAGAIPVFIVRDWIKPFQEQIDWPSFSFSFSPDQVGPSMVEVLRAVSPEQLVVMQRKSIEAYWKIFGGVNDYSMIAANSIDVLTQRLRFHR
eukprot:g12097.t1